MHDEHRGDAPFNPMPPVITAIALGLFGAEALLSLAVQGFLGGQEGVGWRTWVIRNYALKGDMQTWMLQSGRFPADFLKRYLTYPIVHGSFVHMAFAVVILLALGKSVGGIFSAWAVFAIFLLSSVAGAIAFGLSGTSQWLLGAWPGVFGILGAFTFLLWVDLGWQGANRWRAFTLFGLLLAVGLVFRLLFGARLDWIAEVAGFAAGFGLSFIVCPGGWDRAVARLRRR